MKKGGLKRWHAEKWTLADGSECGSNKDKKNPGKCRPSVRVNEDTPKTWGELSESEKAKAKRDKAQANKKNQQFGKLRFMLKRRNKD
jgi:hypothetical protein